MRTIACDLCHGRIFGIYFTVNPEGSGNIRVSKDLCYDCYMKLFDQATDRPVGGGT